jgi:dihydrofolate reductase
VSADQRKCSGPATVLIIAAADNNVIGRDGALPWHLRSDLQRFKALTMGKPIVMGRRTYRSIGRPLPGRTNIVASRDVTFAAPGLIVAPNLAAALETARGDALRRGSDIMVIGGAEIFSQVLPIAQRLELTRVHMRPQGDVTLPDFSETQWREVARRDIAPGPHDDAAFTVLSYERISPNQCGAGAR